MNQLIIYAKNFDLTVNLILAKLIDKVFKSGIKYTQIEFARFLNFWKITQYIEMFNNQEEVTNPESRKLEYLGEPKLITRNKRLSNGNNDDTLVSEIIFELTKSNSQIFQILKIHFHESL